MNRTGAAKPLLQELPQTKSKWTFLYVDHCRISKKDSALKLTDKEGTVYIPSAMISVLLIGPGTNVTHQAMCLIGESGTACVWTGEGNAKFYASGTPSTHKSALLMRQAEMASNQRRHLLVVRKMYQKRFPDEIVEGLTLQQLRGKEGARVRKTYKQFSEQWNVPWSGREYKVDDFDAGTPVNQALSIANACLYGLAYAVIVSLGCSPGLGFIHIGHDKSFVYDLADLYKAETSIPVAFQTAAENPGDIYRTVRRKMRIIMYEQKILERMVADIHDLFSEAEDENAVLADEVKLWNNQREAVEAGVGYEE